MKISKLVKACSFLGQKAKNMLRLICVIVKARFIANRNKQIDLKSLADKIVSCPEFKKLKLHPLAGKIEGNKQYFFDGSFTVFPWGDADMHQFMEWTKGAGEPQEILPFLEILKQLPDSAITIELGAGWGFYSILVGRRLLNAKMILVEANPRIFEVTKRNLECNGLRDRSIVIHGAVSDKDDDTVRFSEDGYGSHIKSDGIYPVKTVSVDGLMKKLSISHVDILHMDIQGEEYKVLLGMNKTLEQGGIDYLFIGTHSRELHLICEAILDSYGYRTLLSLNVGQSVSGDGVLVSVRNGIKLPGIYKESLKDNHYYIRWGKQRKAPTYSNLQDCCRFACPSTPWHWAHNWTLERAQLTGKEIVCDLGSGKNVYPLKQKAYSKDAKKVYLVDNLFLPSLDSDESNISCVNSDISLLPFEDNSLDVVFSVSVFEHLPRSKRLVALKEIERVIKPSGHVLITIGNFLRVNKKAEALMKELPFFVERGCSAYLPIDLKELIDSAGMLRVAGDDGLEFFPGYKQYDEEKLLADENLCLSAYKDYPELKGYADLSPVVYCEIGFMLVKN